jgi:hypothetical protein
MKSSSQFLQQIAAGGVENPLDLLGSARYKARFLAIGRRESVARESLLRNGVFLQDD